MNMNDISKIAHAIKHPHGMYVVGSFDKKFILKIYLDLTQSYLSFILHMSIFLHFLHHDTKFYDIYK